MSNVKLVKINNGVMSGCVGKLDLIDDNGKVKVTVDDITAIETTSNNVSEYTEPSKITYDEAFKRSLRRVLLEYDVRDIDRIMYDLQMSIPFPMDDSEFINLYITRDELGSDINNYIELFGLKTIGYARMLMDNLSNIKRYVNSYLD